MGFWERFQLFLGNQLDIENDQSYNDLKKSISPIIMVLPH